MVQLDVALENMSPCTPCTPSSESATSTASSCLSSPHLIPLPSFSTAIMNANVNANARTTHRNPNGEFEWMGAYSDSQSENGSEFNEQDQLLLLQDGTAESTKSRAQDANRQQAEAHFMEERVKGVRALHAWIMTEARRRERASVHPSASTSTSTTTTTVNTPNSELVDAQYGEPPGGDPRPRPPPPYHHFPIPRYLLEQASEESYFDEIPPNSAYIPRTRGNANEKLAFRSDVPPKPGASVYATALPVPAPLPSRLGTAINFRTFY